MTKMARPYKCDGPNCSHVKGEANHWWLMNIVSELPASGTTALVIIPWNDEVAEVPIWLHICGESCAQKKLSEFMSKATTTTNA